MNITIFHPTHNISITLALAFAFAFTFVSATMTSSTNTNTLTIATRLHLGHASKPPPPSQLHQTLSSFVRLASTVGADHAVVAVDAEEKIKGYDLVEEVTRICHQLNNGGECAGDGSSEEMTDGPLSAPLHVPINVLPVTPWGKFVPALNALVGWCARTGSRYVLMTSAEVKLTKEVMGNMRSKMDPDRTLVVGTVLNGHEYKSSIGEEERHVKLTGRTVPWNTCCLWNVPKLALTGFLLVSEGLHREADGTEGAGGVEEACAVATLQRILGPENAEARLISIPGTQWEQDFGDDVKRKEWHERKMMSKFTRAKKQMDLMGLSGTVIHS